MSNQLDLNEIIRSYVQEFEMTNEQRVNVLDYLCSLSCANDTESSAEFLERVVKEVREQFGDVNVKIVDDEENVVHMSTLGEQDQDDTVDYTDDENFTISVYDYTDDSKLRLLDVSVTFGNSDDDLTSAVVACVGDDADTELLLIVTDHTDYSVKKYSCFVDGGDMYIDLVDEECDNREDVVSLCATVTTTRPDESQSIFFYSTEAFDVYLAHINS